jgi:hypothetical protein
MESKQAKIAIIVLNWNTYELTQKCLNSLSKISYANFQIILVDNGSQDGSGVKLNREFNPAKYFSNSKNLGFTGGNNIALQNLDKSFDYVLLLNSDTEVDTGFLEPLVRRMDSEPNIGAIQPVIFNYENPKIVWNAGGDFNRFIGTSDTVGKGKQFDSLNREKYTDWISGCCILIRKEAIEKVGLLDDRFFAYYEDVDWSLRMKESGYDLGVEYKSIIFHHQGGSTKENNTGNEGALPAYSHYLNIRNHLFILRKHPKAFNTIGSWGYQFIKLIGYSLYFTIRGRFHKLKMVWKGFYDGLTRKI